MTTIEKVQVAGVLVAAAAVVVTLVVHYLPPRPVTLDQGRLEVSGVCREKLEGETRRANYFVILRNVGPAAVDSVKISLAYYGGNKATFDLAGLNFDPPTEHRLEREDQKSAVLSLAAPMPPGDKITVHVGDVVSNENTGSTLPELVAYAKSATSGNVPITWP